MRTRIATILLLATLAGPAAAETLVDQVTRQLAQQGYSEIEVSRTWLGRVRIEASGGGATREIILNPRTGEILRDFWEMEDGGLLLREPDDIDPDVDPDDEFDPEDGGEDDPDDAGEDHFEDDPEDFMEDDPDEDLEDEADEEDDESDEEDDGHEDD